MRLNLVVEGLTEKRFVREVLAPHLGARGVYAVATRITARRSGAQRWRGGLLRYSHLQRDVRQWLASDRGSDARVSTMIDFYGLPADFPGRAEVTASTPLSRVEALERALAADIDNPRFIPYIQLHEFEALLLVDPRSFEWEFLDHAAAINRLAEMAALFPTPEDIDDGATSAPSKRIVTEIPEYEGRKASSAPLIAAKIGIEAMRARCPHFSRWLAQLEGLSAG